MGAIASSDVALVDAELALGAWRVPARSGTVAAASWDEDAFTLATSAAQPLLERTGFTPRVVIAATVSAPLAEPGIGPFLAEALDLQARGDDLGAIVFEQGGSVAAGISAVVAAMAQVAYGGGPVLVVATDDRSDHRGAPLGAGAVAMLLDSAGAAGSFSDPIGSSELFLDRWRRQAERGVRSGDRSLDRYAPPVPGSSGEFLVESSASGPQLNRVGFLGAAAGPVQLLLSGLANGETARVAATAGGVSHVVRFTAGQVFGEVAARATEVVAGGIEGTRPAPPDEESFDPFVSQPMARRERGQTYRLEAMRDPATGEVVFPPPPTEAASGLEPFRLGTTGRVLTFARDHVYPVGGPLTMAVVDLDGGGRFYGQVVDGMEVSIGESVRLVLRRLHSGGGIPQYFWKVQPARGGT